MINTGIIDQLFVSERKTVRVTQCLVVMNDNYLLLLLLSFLGVGILSVARCFSYCQFSPCPTSPVTFELAQGRETMIGQGHTYSVTSFPTKSQQSIYANAIV